MSRKKKNERNYARAGIPLARAERLKKQTDNLAKRPGGGVLGLSTLAVAGVLAAGVIAPRDVNSASVGAFFEDFQLRQEAGVGDTPSLGRRASDRTFGVDTAKPEVDEGQKVASLQSDVTVVSDVQPAEPVVEKALFDVNVNAAYCVRMVAAQIQSLSLSAERDLPWMDMQDDIGRLVQTALDCPASGVQILGSLDLAATDIADMRLRWDRDAYVLELATVASGTLDAPATSVDGQAVEILFR